jgi:hypothetical protein
MNEEKQIESQVQENISLLQSSTQETRDCIHRLLGRLESVLKDPEPTNPDTNKAEKDAPELVPLAMEIRSINNNSVENTNLVLDILKRIRL